MIHDPIPHLKFEPELENAFNAYISQSSRKHIRAAFVIFSLLFAVFSLTDYILVPRWFSLFFAIRFYFVIPAFVITLFLTFHPLFYKWEQPVLLLDLIIGGSSIAAMLILEPLNSIYYGGLFLVFTAGYFMLRLRTRYAVAGGFCIVVFFLAGVLSSGSMSLRVFSSTLFLIAENVLGAFGAYQLERYRRNDFLQVHNLNQTKAQLEKSLIERNKYLEAILQTSADGFFVIDPRKNIIQVNDSYCRMSGYSHDELRGLTINDIDVQEAHQETIARFQRISEHGSEVFETRHRRKDGSIFDVEVSATFLKIDGGQFIGFCRDISGRKRAEKEVQRQLTEKSVLLKEVHHRIKNNLATVSSLLALQSQETMPEARISFESAINRVNTMVVLYEKLLNSEQYDRISCKTYLGEVIGTLESLFSDSVSIEIETQMDEFDLTTKKLFPLGIIVNEIITNILKYAFIGRESGRVSVSLVRVDNLATLCIADNGIGFPDGFDLAKSTGFGLTLVGMLAEQLGGSFSMENDSGTKAILKFII